MKEGDLVDKSHTPKSPHPNTIPQEFCLSQP